MIVVFTPTRRYGGLDVTISSLARQTHKDFTWLVQDELLGARIDIYDYASEKYGIKIDFLMTPKRQENHGNLAAAYNKALDKAISMGANYLISLQDYIWVPDNGIEMFMEVHEAVDLALVTGLTSHSEKPLPEDIADPRGLYTIFKEPLLDKPEGIGWADVRAIDLYPEDHIQTLKCRPEHWETNWASIDLDIVRTGTKFDEDYDIGYAYENMDFAFRASKVGATCVLDKRNHAISLPHRKYFEGEEEEMIERSNRELYEQKCMM